LPARYWTYTPNEPCSLIPARAGSKRIAGKNTRELAGHPLIAYTLAAAQQSGVFSQIVVASDSVETLHLVEELDGRVTCFLRNPSHDDEPDIQWVSRVLYGIGQEWDAFAILRPTSPFRSGETIDNAWRRFWTMTQSPTSIAASSLRAVTPASDHPGKMWRKGAFYLEPLLLQPLGTPWHSQPTQCLPKVYVQNASLEIAWADTVSAAHRHHRRRSHPEHLRNTGLGRTGYQ
jgi:CMP-N,N'-diacetyllegionaminic acid synthase